MEPTNALVASVLRRACVVLTGQASIAIVVALLLVISDLRVRPGWFNQHRTLGALVALAMGLILLAFQVQLRRQRTAAWLGAIVFESVAVGVAVGGVLQSGSFEVDLGVALAIVGLWTLLTPALRKSFLCPALHEYSNGPKSQPAH